MIQKRIKYNFFNSIENKNNFSFITYATVVRRLKHATLSVTFEQLICQNEMPREFHFQSYVIILNNSEC